VTVAESISFVEALRKAQPHGEALPRVRDLKPVTDSLFIFPVAAHNALEWVAGNLDTEALFFHAPLTVQAVFAASLPAGTLPEALAQIASLQRVGAVCMIGRTANLQWLETLKRRGCIETCVEDDGRNSRRYIMPPPFFADWFSRASRHYESKDLRGH